MSKTKTHKNRGTRKSKLDASNPFDVLKLFVGDFSSKSTQELFPHATAIMAKAEKVARAFLEEVRADAKKPKSYEIPILALTPERFGFGDMVDLRGFFMAPDTPFAKVTVLRESYGITSKEVETIFLYDESEMLVALTCLACVLLEQEEFGKNKVNEGFFDYFLSSLSQLLSVAMKANGIEPKAGTKH
ncbi:hypothetical protein [Sinorhizobium fredii]|uniref:hypothetical protein n=1 Tax=Rhizobium fredii TaxID=380 RepID=UPI0004BB52C4|nr:hypothetical protein [Sinorhizobium fredii]AWM24070.1 hypothetical protein AOX55_0000793 [Sinorhizobium fredii CCBAU 25509]